MQENTCSPHYFRYQNMDDGLENAPLRLHVAENVITAVFSVHQCDCTEARLPTGCWGRKTLRKAHFCKMWDSSFGDFSWTPHLSGRTLRTALQPKTPPSQLPSFLPLFLPEGQVSIMLLRLSPLPLSSLPWFLHRNFLQTISCISNTILVPTSQKNLSFSY